MSPELIQSFMLKNGECFDLMTIPEIQKRLGELDDSKAPMLMGLGLQNPTLILLLAILFGWERFFLDDIALGIVKVITCYGCGIWWLVDIFTAKKRTYEYNYKRFNQMLMFSK
ncbi:MAG: TM2 domain-containing protein [Bacteroidales bacterium]|nr:TM2 domain-containing protein [Bacteroidales bacterium]